jgi:hypothetical protein
MYNDSEQDQGRGLVAPVRPLPDPSSLEDLKDGILNSDPACLLDRELFDGPADGIESETDRSVRETVAREVCAECPARSRCLVYALATRPESGVWAGLTAQELARVFPASALHPTHPPRTPHHAAVCRGFGEVAL